MFVQQPNLQTRDLLLVFRTFLEDQGGTMKEKATTLATTSFRYLSLLHP